MRKTQSAAELAEAERAAIRAELAARNIPEERKEPEFKPTAAAARAGRARRLIGPVELAAEDAAAAPKRISWHDINERDYARLRLAEDTREAARYEREAARAARDEKRRVAESRRLAEVVIREVPSHAAAMFAAAGLSADVEAVRQLAEAAAAAGMEPAEVAELAALERAYSDTPKPAARPRAGYGYSTTLTPAQLAEVRTWTKSGLATPAAEAGRAALAAIGPRAAGLVLTNRTAQTVTIARAVKVPPVGVATKRADTLAAELAEAETKLAAAEAAVRAARGRKAKRPITAAEDAANRSAEAVKKLAARAALAARLADVAERLDGMNLAELEPSVAEPVVKFPLDKAADAAAVNLRTRADNMPVQFRHNGPSVKAARLVSGRGHLTMAASGVSDPTGESAAALADGYRAALAAAERAAARAAAVSAAADKAERAARSEEKRAARKAQHAAHMRDVRRAAKLRNR